MTGDDLFGAPGSRKPKMPYQLAVPSRIDMPTKVAKVGPHWIPGSPPFYPPGLRIAVIDCVRSGESDLTAGRQPRYPNHVSDPRL